MRRIRSLTLALSGVALFLGCVTLGTPKYSPPPKNYPTLFTFNKGTDAVWDSALGALATMGFEVASADKASGKIETGWADTGWGPARKCQYGLSTYWENPTRRQQLSVVVKNVPGAPSAPAAPTFPGAAPGFPGAQPGYGQPGMMPGGQPGYGQPGMMPGAQPGMPGGQPGYGQPGGQPGYGQPGMMPGMQPGFPMAAPAVSVSKTMVIVVGKGESVLPEDCGGEPAVVEIANTDTVTEYRFLHEIGRGVGQQMEAPPAAD